jgi:F-type H+-transporting ATPase subunit gamma
MSARLSDLTNRISTMRQLDGVIGAMRAIAAARVSEAQTRLAGIRACAATVGEAIAAVLPLAPEQAHAQADRQSVHPHASIAIVLCSEQGFVGALNARIVEQAQALAHTHADAYPHDARREYLLVGSRGLPFARAAGLSLVWSAPAAAHVGDVDALASSLIDALYARLAANPDATVSVIHAMADSARHVRVAERLLLPFSFARFPTSHQRPAPLVQVPVRELLAGLVEAYVYTEVCEAMTLSFAAENEARIQAMLAGRTNVQERLEHLVGEYRHLRQEEITSEIVELTAGTAAVH